MAQTFERQRTEDHDFLGVGSAPVVDSPQASEPAQGRCGDGAYTTAQSKKNDPILIVGYHWDRTPQWALRVLVNVP